MSLLHRGWRSTLRKLQPTHLSETLTVARSSEPLIVDWVHRGAVKDNWGDAIAPEIVQRLSGRPVVNRRDVFNPTGRPVFTTIGSMFGTIDVDGFEAWGTGFVDSRSSLRARPGRVHAVRGPLTWKKLADEGVLAPELFADPALLYPRLYTRDVEIVHDLGIIPHFKEQDLPAVDALRRAGAHIIDIKGRATQVVDEINRCRQIASSSLHGLVAADAYGVPAIWVRFSDRPAGDGFKFKDYLASTSSRREGALEVMPGTNIDEVQQQIAKDPPHHATLTALASELLDACPFLDRSRVLTDGSVA